MYSCPVCGYANLRRPPEIALICPSCGTQFGYSDSGPEPIALIHAGLRAGWIDRGANWHSTVVPKPEYWNPWLQLYQAGFLLEVPWLGGVQVGESTASVGVGSARANFNERIQFQAA
jgi:hypothetical protein